jgi:hypothetical protein
MYLRWMNPHNKIHNILGCSGHNTHPHQEALLVRIRQALILKFRSDGAHWDYTSSRVRNFRICLSAKCRTLLIQMRWIDKQQIPQRDTRQPPSSDIMEEYGWQELQKEEVYYVAQANWNIWVVSSIESVQSIGGTSYRHVAVKVTVRLCKAS